MRPVVLTATATGASSPVVMDQYISPFNVGMGFVTSSTGNVATVQHTFDNPQTTTFATGATWFNNTTMATMTANTDGNYAFPVSAIRLNCVTLATSASPTMSLTIMQAGIVA